MGKSTDEIVEMLHYAAVVNPRKTALRSDYQLPDRRNFILLDKYTGKLVLHGCNGVLFLHDVSLKERVEKNHHSLFTENSHGTSAACVGWIRRTAP